MSKSQLILAAVLVFTGVAHAKNESQPHPRALMSALFSGPPKLAATKLDPAAYVEEEVQKLSSARIAYVNWGALEDIFKRLGYANPPKEMTPEFEKAVLDYGGFAKRMKGEDKKFFKSQFRTLYSIRYGGHWINYNFGSGRNGAGGEVDIKGIGKTVLVRPWADGGHGNGVVSLSEAIKEVVWSNILHEELPLGANRVLFILTTGTKADTTNPNSEARALIVREDMVRPAYFQQNVAVDSELLTEEQKEFHKTGDANRMAKLLPKFLENLPKPANVNPSWSAPQLLRASYFEMIDRVAKQYARAHVMQILLAGTSTSNVEIDGTALDYGATTAVLGYSKIRYLREESENGNADALKSDLFMELAGDLRQVLEPELAAALPSDKEIAERIDHQYNTQVEKGFLELAGVPREFSLELLFTAEGRRFAQTILKIARAGNSEVLYWTGPHGMKKTDTYDLSKVLPGLLLRGQGFAEHLWIQSLPDASLRAELTRDFSAAFTKLSEISRRHGITAPALRKYMEMAAGSRNRPLTAWVSDDSLWEDLKKIGEKFESGDDVAIQEFADGSFENSVREFRGGPFELVVKSKKNLGRGFRTRTHLNLLTGEVRDKSEVLPGRSCQPLLRSK